MLQNLLKLFFFLLLAALVSCKSLNDTNKNTEELNLIDSQAETLTIKKSVTYPDIGTFHRDDFYHATRRPIRILPQSPEKISTKFLLYTRKNLKEAQQIKTSEDVKKSNFNKNHETKFIIHGFLDNQLFGKWMSTLKDEFLMAGQYNVFIVDWSGGNGLPYMQATVNTRVVGPVVANTITMIQKTTGISLSSVHLIGHSLGSHISGYAGERLNKVGRITGLDPAGPYFEYLPPNVRLDPTDGRFVDAIHSDAKALIPYLGLGTMHAMGHVDFYPNGGVDQPGCDKERFTSIFIHGIAEGARRLVACNHQRAVDFFTASINHNRNVPVAYECSNFESYIKGECTSCGVSNDGCAILGHRADEWFKNKGRDEFKKMYLRTNPTYPYFVNEYQVQVKLADGTTKTGSVTVNISGDKTNVLSEVIHKQKLLANKVYHSLVKAPYQLGDVKKVTLKWKNTDVHVIKKSIRVEQIRVAPMFALSDRTNAIKSFCKSDGGNVKENTETVFDKIC